MCIRRVDLQPGAYVHDPTTKGLYEVRDNLQTTVRLIDVRSPIDQPRTMSMLIGAALNRLDLIRPAPCLEDVASVAEYGHSGTAPT